VLGDMAELGPGAADAHAQIGEFARGAGLERLYAYGPLSKRAAASFGAGAHAFADFAALTEAVSTALLTEAVSGTLGNEGPGVRVLIKGSRFNRLERLVSMLTGDAAAGGH
jgi:UDP-N-acetylmuramoyl-tripeptide--D-alanyl-D-alanine ligase